MPLPTQLMSIIFFPSWIHNLFQIHSGEKAAFRLCRSLGHWATSCIETRFAHFQELLRGPLVASLIEATLTPIYNHGQTSWDTFAFLGHFPIHTGPTSPLTPQTMLDACIQIFFRVSTLYRLGEARTARKSRKGCTILRGNREMTEKYEYCSTVPRTFVQDCRYFVTAYLFLHEPAFRPYEISEFTHRNSIFLKPLSRLV